MGCFMRNVIYALVSALNIVIAPSTGTVSGKYSSTLIIHCSIMRFGVIFTSRLSCQDVESALTISTVISMQCASQARPLSHRQHHLLFGDLETPSSAYNTTA